MLDKKQFALIKEKYGYWASWAIWAAEGETPKSNVGDLSVFDSEDVLAHLKPDIILVGLNISRGDIKFPLANFHGARSEATDYKIRYALKDTPLWGGYMTDIIKDFEQKSSGKVVSYLRANKSFEEENVRIFRDEIRDLGVTSPTIISFGRDTHSILSRHLQDEYNLLKVPHYANYTSKEKYREEVSSIWRDLR